VYGFKLLSYQLRNIQNRIPDERAFLKQLTEEGFRILYLQRKNIANQALSLIYAMSRNKWHAKDKAEQEDRKITIQPETLQYYKEELEKLRKYEAQLLSGLPCLEIHYEDDLENPEQQQETMGRVFAYIGVNPTRVESTLQKVTPRDHRNYILNYDDIAPLLKS
jgi:LPS sulfotransferase NodH